MRSGGHRAGDPVRPLRRTEEIRAAGNQQLYEALAYTDGIRPVPSHPCSDRPVSRRGEHHSVNREPLAEELGPYEGYGEGEGPAHGSLGPEDGVRPRIQDYVPEAVPGLGRVDEDGHTLPRRGEPTVRLQQLPCGLHGWIGPERTDLGRGLCRGTVAAHLGCSGVPPERNELRVVSSKERHGPQVRCDDLRPGGEAREGVLGPEHHVPAIPEADGSLDQ